MIDADQFIEWMMVHENMYGTSVGQINGIIEAGKIPLLDIDVQGALKFEEKFPLSNFLVIHAGSIETLR